MMARETSQEARSGRGVPFFMGSALFVLAVAVVIATIVATATGTPVHMAAMLPDDAFYYLMIARNLAERGLASFDGGQTLTSGYHPLWAGVLTVLAHIFGSDRVAMLRAAVVVSGVLSLLVVVPPGMLALRRRDGLVLAVLGVLLVSFSFINNSVSAMEWPLVMLAAAAAMALLWGDGPAGPARCAALLAVGIAGSLSRTDFGGYAFSLFAAALVVWLWLGQKRFLIPALCLLIGAAAGLGLATLYHYLHTGSLVQGSAAIKLQWAKHAGFSPFPFALAFFRSLVYLPSSQLGIADKLVPYTRQIAAVLVVVAVAVAIPVWRCRHRLGRGLKASVAVFPRQHAFFLLASLFAIIGYTLVYSANSMALQIWYTANITVPVFVILVLLGRQVALAVGTSRVVGACAVLFVLNVALFVLSPPIYVKQERIPPVGLALRAHMAGHRVGISDAGIVNFFQGGDVINLDGLVNDDIAHFIPDRLHCYLLVKKIEFFTGFGAAAARSFPLVDFAQYSTVQDLPLANGEVFPLLHVDFAALRARPECQTTGAPRGPAAMER